MLRSPKVTEVKINGMLRAWKDVCPMQSFSNLTLDQATALVKPSLDARAEIAELESRMQAAIARRDAADVVSLQVVNRVVHCVKGDAAQGEDGELYAATGYTRRSRRAKGGRRRGTVTNEVKDTKEVTVTKTEAS